MASQKAAGDKPSLKNPKKQRKPALGPNKAKKRKLRDSDNKIEKRKNSDLITDGEQTSENGCDGDQGPASDKLGFFINQFESANGVKLSSLELESIKDNCIVVPSHDLPEDVENLGEHMKALCGTSWKEVLCGGEFREGKIDPGSPAVLLISSSALRSLELLRGVRSLSKECPAVKLFSKHMKVEEQIEFDHNVLMQVALLKKRVNIASGTPSRIKKLIDVEAFGLSRLRLIMLDMHTDVKGYSLMTLPQVRDEFWDLYKSYFHQKVVEGDLSICLYGPIPSCIKIKGKKKKGSDE